MVGGATLARPIKRPSFAQEILATMYFEAKRLLLFDALLEVLLHQAVDSDLNSCADGHAQGNPSLLLRTFSSCLLQSLDIIVGELNISSRNVGLKSSFSARGGQGDGCL